MNFITQKDNLHTSSASLASKGTRAENGLSSLMTTRLPRLQNITPGSKPKPNIIYLSICNITICLEENLGFCDAFFLHFPCTLQVVQMPMKNAPPPAGRAISTSEIHQPKVWTLCFCPVEWINISTRQLCFIFNIACFMMTQLERA